jgi:hypothetical protein
MDFNTDYNRVHKSLGGNGKRYKAYSWKGAGRVL